MQGKVLVVDNELVEKLKNEVTYKDGRLKIVSSSIYDKYSQDEISSFCVLNGFYSLPTIELKEFIIPIIKDKKCVEIGAGQGSLAKWMGIEACDNFMQDWPWMVAYYKSMRQATVPYDHDYVQNCDANNFVKIRRAEVVLGQWITHRWNPDEPEREGSEFGVDEEEILKTSDYIFVGNMDTHKNKPIFKYPHKIYRPLWLNSRGFNKKENVIIVWNRL